VAKTAITVAGPRAAAGAVAIALAAPAGPVIANMDDSAADQDGPGASAPPTAAGDASVLAEAVLAEAVRRARRPVVLLGTGAIPATAAVRDALAGRGIPALHTYRARGVLPDSAAEAAGLVTGGTMEWPLLSAADLIVGLGVDEAEMIPERWDFIAARTIPRGPGARSPRRFRPVHRRDRAEHPSHRGTRCAGRRSRARLAGGRGAGG
jgi:acetolactate synthase-1/2/3 large subunit